MNFLVSIDIKLINTILSGCEYTIDKDNLFIIVNQKWLATKESLAMPKHGILIPTAKDNPCNFSITFPENHETDFKIVIHHSDDTEPNEEIVLHFNQIYSIGNVKFIAKRTDQTWNASPEESSDDESGLIGRLTIAKKFPLLRKLQKKYLPYLLLILISAGLVVFGWYSYTEPQRRTQNLAELFQKNEKIEVLLGIDNKVYILAQDSKSLRLAQDILNNNPSESPALIKFKNVAKEKNEIAFWLTKNWPDVKWNAFNLDNMSQPILFLSQQRAKPFTATSKQRFLSEFNTKVPYAKNLSFSFMDDALLVSQAKHGLEQLNIHYQLELNPSYGAFIIQGELDDSDLLRLKQFISDFYQKWGDNYIKFVITLNRDFLKNYSFKNGEQNYIKMSNNHWYIAI